jgi:hypothetical protein
MPHLVCKRLQKEDGNTNINEPTREMSCCKIDKSMNEYNWLISSLHSRANSDGSSSLQQSK